MTAEKWAWKLFLGAGVGVMAAYFALPGPSAQDVTYSAVGISSTVAILVALRLHRPAERAGWRLIAAGNLCFVAGDGVYDVYQWFLHRATPFPSLADLLYLSGYPLILIGLVRIVRGRDSERRGTYLDAAMVVAGALALSWQLVMGVYARDHTLSVLGKAVSMAYPLMDLGLLFVVANAIFAGFGRPMALQLVAWSLIAMIAGDLIDDVLVLHASYSTGNPVDATWLANYVLLGAAALHPSMASRPPPRQGAVDRWSLRRRLLAVGLAGLVAPALLLADSFAGIHRDMVVVAAVSTVMLPLMIGRIWLLLERVGWQSEELGQRAVSLQAALAVQKSLERDLRRQAFHDGLTGLPNRELFNSRLAEALAAAAVRGGTVAVCYCDFDGFKAVNDTLGHRAGDELLVANAERLASAVRHPDVVARMGGDEFAVLMEGVPDLSVATAVAERIIALLRQPVTIGGRLISLSASVGIAVSDGSATAEQILSEADSAMYKAKGAGKNRFAVFEVAMAVEARERLELISGFADAASGGQLFLEYQPQFSLHDGRLENCEALLRWRHPTLGVLSPDRFIPLAEETGHITSLGWWVIRQACRDAASWPPPADGGPAPSVSINVSGRQLSDTALASDIGEALARSGLPAQRVILEITETLLVSDPDLTAQVLRELRDTGVRIAVDDFGTGYSSLSYLREFPVDLLKIDKAFVDPLSETNHQAVAFFSTIVSLARSLGARTVAEGIEQDAQYQLIRQLGCDSVQGFLLAKPMANDALHQFLGAGALAPSAQLAADSGS